MFSGRASSALNHESPLSCFFFLFVFFRQDLLLNLEFCNSARLVGQQTWGLPAILELQKCIIAVGFVCGFWGVEGANSGPHACTAGTLLTEPSFQAILKTWTQIMRNRGTRALETMQSEELLVRLAASGKEDTGNNP